MKKVLACLMAMMLILGICPSLAEAPEEANDLDTLTVGSATAMSGYFFTDLWGRNTADMDVRTLLHGYDLIHWDSEKSAFDIDNSVVKGIVVTEDDEGNRTYTLAIQEDLCYSDGTAITAEDYAFSLLFSIAPEVAEIGGMIKSAEYILGIEAYKSGESDMLSGVRLPGGNQLSITVKAEYLPFFYELALLSITPYPIHVIAPGCEVADDGEGICIRNADQTVADTAFTAELLRKTVLDPENGYLSHPAVTSGPYKLVSYSAESQTAEFEINPFYKGNSKGVVPQIQHLIFTHVSNEDMIAMLQSGEIDLLNKCVNVNVLDDGMRLVADGVANVSNYARNGFSFISFSCERTATSSAKVRQAIACCFDKDTFINQYVRNYGLRVDGYYGIGQWMFGMVEGTAEPPVEEPDENAGKAEQEAYEKALEQWDALSLDNVTVYQLDLEAAKQLLEDDGWTLNRAGAAYDPQKDDVRCREIDGVLVPLELSLIYPEGNAAGEALDTVLVQNLAQVGIVLTVEAKPFTELLRIYYRQEARECDMIYLASNFTSVYEPSAAFNPENAAQGMDNVSGITDPELFELAVDMRQTEPGDVLGYCQKWVAFQEAWAELLPAIPVYSNVYFDFYTPVLQKYNASASNGWAEAIVSAYLSDVEVVEETEVGEDVFVE